MHSNENDANKNREYTSLTEKVIWETAADTSAHFLSLSWEKLSSDVKRIVAKRSKVIGAARTWPWICHVPKLN